MASADLPDRELHHSRMFVDLAENIHIHYREYRLIFSLPEFFEFSDILEKSVQDVRNYLEQNKDYKEQTYPTTLIVAGGRSRQLKYLENSPSSNKSYYLDNKLTIELQDEYVTDEIHIHYRDFRIGLDRKRFRILAENFKKALDNLDTFEKNNSYLRKNHSDRDVKDFNNKEILTEDFPYIKNVNVVEIKSYNYPDFPNNWKGDRNFIDRLKKNLASEKKAINIAPIILTKKENDNYFIIDGHHRYLAYLEAGKTKIDAILTNLTFKDSEKLRLAESNLKQFDFETNNKFGLADFYKSYLGFKLNSYYSSHYSRHIFKNSRFYRFLRKIKQLVFGKEYIFKNFFEKINK